MSLRRANTAELQRELDRRERGASKILKQRDKLAAQLEKLERELVELGISSGKPNRRAGRRRGPGRPPGRKPGRKPRKAPRTRAKNKLSLHDAILAGTRAGATVTPARAAEAAKKEGYKSTSKHFGMMVANALAKSPDFKRIARGSYKRVGSGKAGAGRRGRPKTAKTRRAKPKARKSRNTARRRKTPKKPRPASARKTPKRRRKASPRTARTKRGRGKVSRSSTKPKAATSAPAPATPVSSAAATAGT